MLYPSLISSVAVKPKVLVVSVLTAWLFTAMSAHAQDAVEGAVASEPSAAQETAAGNMRDIEPTAEVVAGAVADQAAASEGEHNTATSVDAELTAASEQEAALDSLPNSGQAMEKVENAALPHDLTPIGMYNQADWVVKGVMIGLMLASILTWTVFVAKSAELRSAVKHQRQLLAKLLESRSLNEARMASKNLKSTAMLEQAAQELQQSGDALDDREGVKERVESILERLVFAQGRVITKGTGVLATIGSTAPFVGLFGTVWGIMNSFIGISEAQTTNLAVVAPGIAEALLATALGLVAAIPAVIIYNHFARQVAAYKGLLGDSAAAIERLVSRDLSRGITPPVVTKVREA